MHSTYLKKPFCQIGENQFVQLIHIRFRCIALYSPNKGFTRRYIKILIGFAWIAAFLPLIPSFFGFYGDHGLECQTRQCKILSDGEHGHVKRRFELFLHVCWAVLLVAANLGLFLRYWVKTGKIRYQIINGKNKDRIRLGYPLHLYIHFSLDSEPRQQTQGLCYMNKTKK